MKKTVVIYLALFLFYNSYSQDNVDSRNFKIGITSMVGICQPIRFERVDEDVSFEGKFTSSIGIDFSKFIRDKNAIQFGILYSTYRTRVEIIAGSIPPPMDPFTEEINMLSIPISYQRFFNHFFFVSIGSILDLELSRNSDFTLVDTQSGFGLTFSAGKEFHFNRLTLNLAPCLQIHSFAPIKTERYQQRLSAAILQMGLYYNFK